MKTPNWRRVSKSWKSTQWEKTNCLRSSWWSRKLSLVIIAITGSRLRRLQHPNASLSVSKLKPIWLWTWKTRSSEWTLNTRKSLMKSKDSNGTYRAASGPRSRWRSKSTWMSASDSAKNSRKLWDLKIHLLTLKSWRLSRRNSSKEMPSSKKCRAIIAS